jgi:hypothetical protein
MFDSIFASLISAITQLFSTTILGWLTDLLGSVFPEA